MIKYFLLIFLLLTTSLNALSDKQMKKYISTKQEYLEISKDVSKYTGWNYKKMFSWGYSETEHRDMICYNVPEWKYSNGKVKRFSIDIGWPQINSQNWVWVYTKAVKFQTEGKIRQDLILYKFPIKWLRNQEAQYKKFGAKGMKNREFKCDRDCKESMLYYRWIIEKYRGKYDWNRNFENHFLDLPQK